jgi:hypothetical protein
LWTYENLFVSPNSDWATTSFFPVFNTGMQGYFDLIADTIAINPNDMNVVRAGDGGQVEF